MTTTGEDVRPLPLIGQAVGQAQASLARETNTTEGNR
jgi:hypothetical protein